jgi:hypothetical protein
MTVVEFAPVRVTLGAPGAGGGGGGVVVKVAAPEVPPPGAGVTTVTETERAVARSTAVIAARS